MKLPKIDLLDCTLRDGGYINDWKWGHGRAMAIINLLVKANTDVVEVGFLRDIDRYDRNVTVSNYIEDLNELLPSDSGETIFSAMAMRSNYDERKLRPYSGKGIELIRITAHDYDLNDVFVFAKNIHDKGYKVSINPINIMGYKDDEILQIVDKVNKVQPYQFSIVDTFGSMKRRDLDRIVSLVDNNLDRHIRVALHLHENMSLSTCLAQNYIDKHLNRPIAIDGSLMGMGRIPGNLPIELIADYLNEYSDKNYDIDYMMDAIQDYIAPIRGKNEWGYTPAFFLSARFNLHRNYAEYYLKKGDLTHRDINHILSRFDRKKCTTFDLAYAESQYVEYKNNVIEDTIYINTLKNELFDSNILLIAPGSSILEYEEFIRKYINEYHPKVITINFVYNKVKVDYAFFSNNKRYNRVENPRCKVISTSNLPEAGSDFRINYNGLVGPFEQGSNSLVMALSLIKRLGISHVVIAGADGFKEGMKNYYSSGISSHDEHGAKYNHLVAESIKKIGVNVTFITPSEYSSYI